MNIKILHFNKQSVKDCYFIADFEEFDAYGGDGSFIDGLYIGIYINHIAIWMVYNGVLNNSTIENLPSNYGILGAVITELYKSLNF